MEKINPYNRHDPEQWKRHNEEAMKNIHDEALKAIINGVLNLHELEHTGNWKKAGRRIDYSNSTFEVYLQHHTTWSLKDFRLLEEAVFEHFDELKRSGMGSVLKRMKKMKNEPNPLLDRRLKRTNKRVES
ncbi:MAG: hypothetical protein JSW26_07200 [Desulfobacterales bacterium]|nr:MAG: hypothetical protein JSW26_07200 [Desulfobacterales bacterium]